MENQTRFVYVLCDPLTSLIGYAGLTVCLRDRFKAHVFTPLPKLRASDNPKDKWIVSLADGGLLPALEIADVLNGVGEQQARIIEHGWQWWLRDYGRVIGRFELHCRREHGSSLPEQKCREDHIDSAKSQKFRRARA